MLHLDDLLVLDYRFRLRLPLPFAGAVVALVSTWFSHPVTSNFACFPFSFQESGLYSTPY